MATYKSANDDTMYYPELGLLIAPNEETELPDGTLVNGLEVVQVKGKTAPVAAPAAEGVSD